MNRLKTGHKIAIIVVVAVLVLYVVVDFIGGMMYFDSPQPGLTSKSYYACYDGFCLSGNSRTSFDYMSVDSRSTAVAGFAVRLPSGEEVPIDDPSLKSALLAAGAKKDDFLGVESLSLRELSFECEGESISRIGAGRMSMSGSSHTTTINEPRLFYRGTELLFPMSAREMCRIFGTSYRLEYR